MYVFHKCCCRYPKYIPEGKSHFEYTETRFPSEFLFSIFSAISTNKMTMTIFVQLLICKQFISPMFILLILPYTAKHCNLQRTHKARRPCWASQPCITRTSWKRSAWLTCRAHATGWTYTWISQYTHHMQLSTGLSAVAQLQYTSTNVFICFVVKMRV